MSRTNRRTFLQGTLAAGAAAALPLSRVRAESAAEEIGLGFISCGGRAGELMRAFGKVGGIRVTALCDPDEQRLGSAKQRFPQATASTDLRKLLDNPAVDAVVISTCNHWHCLAAVWAMQAGKHVYVEKPLSHSQWEGRQTVRAARKYGKVCQVGTQQRSDPMQAQIKRFLHEERGLGEIRVVRVNRYGVRAPIGKRSTPLRIDPAVAYDLWLGPAQDKPLFRSKLHYDWHWDWNTGSGEMGNWGVHVLDDVRNNVFLDKVTLPKRILGGGGRVAWNDAGETPNVHFVYFDTGSIPVVIGLSNLTAAPGKRGAAKHPGPGSGYIVYGEGGRLEGQRGRATAFDNRGKKLRSFKGDSGMLHHQRNFLDAIRADNAGGLTADVEVGHHSTGWCNLANIAGRLGGQFERRAATALADGSGIWAGLLEETERHLRAHGVSMSDPEIRLSSVLEFDPKEERFVGESAEGANQLLKREYRRGFEFPELG